MKKLALLVYPEFSLQEVMNLSRLFRWNYNTMTEVISSDKAPVKSEEGILVLPEKTTEDFDDSDYSCLILPGCSDFTEVFQDKKIFCFLSHFQQKTDFPIGAICSSPLLLARSGVLTGKQWTASIFMDFFDFLPFLERENYVPAPLVISNNIVTAQGNHFNDFAVAMAHLLGFECPAHIFSGHSDSWKKEDYIHYLPKKAISQTKRMFEITD